MARIPYFRVLITTILQTLMYNGVCKAAKADTWDSCNCTFEEWQNWDDCTTQCFGQRYTEGAAKVRERSVIFGEYEDCNDFTDCATEDERYEWGNCNTLCHNEGIVTGDLAVPCSCASGYYGLCCAERVDCGTPDTLPNGDVSVPATDYDSVAVYTCDPLYNLTDGDALRYCMNNFTWSGTAPNCIFVNNCTSTPCMHGATCVDLLADFQCHCAQGWSGQLCEIDVHPPVTEGCSGDVMLNATERIIRYNWSTPIFTDPMGTELNITTNHETPDGMFPWGDHTVNYTATKLLNGLQTRCSFQIKVRPTPCAELNVPVNGARLCNGWRTDYGRYCMMTCVKNYTLGPLFSFRTWRVCGASGTWVPANPLPDCLLRVYSVEDASVYQPEYEKFVYQSHCRDALTQTSLKHLYIDELKAHHGLASTCTSYTDDCLPENVDVTCN